MAALWNRAGHYIFIMWFLLFISSSFFLASVGPLAADAENGLPVWGTPSKFQWGSGFGFVTAPTSLSRDQPNLSRCLAVSWAGKLYRHFRGLLLPNGILPGALFTFRPSLAFSYICSVTARHSSSGREPNFAAFSRGRHLYSAGRPSRWASAHILVMAALRSRCGHYIFALWFLSFYLSFFPHLISAATDWMSTILLYTWRGSSANLKCRFEMCCTRLAEIQDAKKSPTIAIWAPSHNLVGLYLRNYGTHRQSEKNLLSSNTSSTCPYNMVNFGPSGWVPFVSLGHPS